MQKIIPSNQFLAAAQGQIPRLLGQLNRNYSSRSYGSFDRAYWHYRTNGISCARYQEAVYTLALLYCHEFEGNEYYRDEKVLEWVRAALRFTAGLQRRDGSFDEWYQNEGSYVATAFLAAALGETLLLFKKTGVVIEEEELVAGVLGRAAGFLANSSENTVMNQVSGAIAAIVCAGLVCKKKEFLVFADRILEGFLAKQNTEGWWSEYGGPDVGYLSLTISYLEKYQRLTGSTAADAAIAGAKAFVEKFIHPDRTAGGEYMSRNTEYLVPSAALPYLGALQPAQLDDRYLCYVLYNWIETGLKTAPKEIPSLFGEEYLPESGLLRAMNGKYFLAANGSKGGSLRIYAGGKVYYDSGLEIASARGALSTGLLDAANRVSFEQGSLRVAGAAKTIQEPLLEGVTAVAFTLWQLLFGRAAFLQRIVKKFLRQRMISYSGGSPVSFERAVEYGPHSVRIIDTVRGVTGRDAIVFGVKSAYSAVPSSKYAPAPELAARMLLPLVEESEEGGVYTIKRTFSFDD